MANLTQTQQRETGTMSPQETQRTGRLEVNTLPKKDFHQVQINKVGPQHDYVQYRKPGLLDAPVDNRPNMTWKDY